MSQGLGLRLLHDVRTMGFDGDFFDVQFASDLLV
jgi:hypothetical protein